MATRVLTGLAELDANLAQLQTNVANRVSMATLRAGVKAISKNIKRAAASHTKSGSLEQSIGDRVQRGKGGTVVTAKAGVSVGKRRKTKTENKGKFIGQARHAHLVALGTAQRKRKKIGGLFSYIRNPTDEQLDTGTMPADDFVKRGYSAAQGEMQSAMIAAATKTLTREADKLTKKR